MISTQSTPFRQLDFSTAPGGGTDALPRPRVLVLMAAYNGARWIREQMETVLAQEGVDVKVAVRDDGSSDGTHWELARFADDDRVELAAAAAPSGSAGQNFVGLICENPSTSFDFVAFADQDDLWNRDKLARACRMLADGGFAGYSSATTATWADGRERTLKLSGAPTTRDFLLEGAGQGCTFVLTAPFYERVRSFLASHRDSTLGLHYHDWLVYALARSWELTWGFDTQPSMKYRQHRKNDTGARGTLLGVTRRLSRIRQGWYRTQLHAIARLCAAAAPANDLVSLWHRQLGRADSPSRRVQLARLCLSGGRRRARDNMIAILAALAGWI
jgi:rhamnosyltransferase